jgi:hypothetical protein
LAAAAEEADLRLTSLLAVTPLFDATIPVYRAAIAEGHGEVDTAAVRLALEASAKRL